MAKGFMSELKGYRRLALGNTERLFLTFFCLVGNKTTNKNDKLWIGMGYGLSAWKIFSDLRQTEASMTYHNAHKTVMKLRDLGLIEEIKEKHHYRNAIKYKATSRGLFQRLLTQQGNPVSMGVLKNYEGSIILQTILFKLFKYETIKEFRRYYALRYVTNYLTRCCDSIIGMIEHGKPSDLEIDKSVLQEVKKLVFTIVTISKDVIDDPDIPNIKSIFPIATLANDEKFMKILHEMKNDFDSGYQKIKSALS